jgi:HAD superfamily hydrolase (TIGR01549 family)
VKTDLIKVVGFDCDGVMFDSSHANRAYYNHILNHFKMAAMTPEQFAFAHMHTVDETLAFLIRDSRTLLAAQEFRKQMSYLPFIRHMVAEQFLQAVLDELRPAYKTAIATNRTDTMERVLIEHNLEGCFDYVVTAQDVARPKPHPDQLLAILKHFAIEPHEMVFVGDSQLDAVAAQRSQVPFIAYQNPDLTADRHIRNLNELLGILNL